jgi:hypothetical protein
MEGKKKTKTIIVEVAGSGGEPQQRHYPADMSVVDMVREALWDMGAHPVPIEHEWMYAGWSRVVINFGPSEDEDEEECEHE